MSERRRATVSPATGGAANAGPWGVQSASVPVSKSRLSGRPASSVGRTPAAGPAGPGSAAGEPPASAIMRTMAARRDDRLSVGMALPRNRRHRIDPPPMLLGRGALRNPAAAAPPLARGRGPPAHPRGAPPPPRPSAPPLVDERGDEGRPSRLVRGAQARPVIAVEILVEQHQVAPVRVVLVLGRPAEDRPAAVRV